MNVKSAVIPRGQIAAIWNTLLPGIEDYRGRTPHELPENDELLLSLQSPDGDELFAFGVDGRYGGFMTFRVQPFDGEIWGTIAMIYVRPEFQRGDALAEAARQLEDILRQRGCTVMNYVTKRKGFRKLAPRLGFQSRIIEWAKEL